MLPRLSVEVAGTTMLALLRLLERMPARYGANANAVVDEAILAWIAAQQQQQSRDPAGRGYRWKTVFLPAGTRLEVRTHGETFRAQVVDDEIRHEGQSVSPNGFVAACAGATRNAWREISLLLPGERYWKPAYMLRREVERSQALAAEAATSAAKAGATVPLPGRDVEHWWDVPPRERRLEGDRRSPRGCTDFDDH